jgi:hypothetical protein
MICLPSTVNPAAQKQPALALDQATHRATLAEELCVAHFIDGRIGMLHHMELVVYDHAVRSPSLNAGRKGGPHVHARRRDLPSLPLTQLRLEEFVQGFLLAVLTEPQRFATLQVADYGEELDLLAEEDLIDPQFLIPLALLEFFRGGAVCPRRCSPSIVDKS